MQISKLENIKDFSLPLPIYETVHIADAVKDGEEFRIVVGLDRNLVEQLKNYSADESDVELQKNTGDKSRFSEGSYEEWYKKSRTPFALIYKKTGALAALAWFGPKPLGEKSPRFGKEREYEKQDKWHTPAFRSYIPFRGKGLMKDFILFVMDFYKIKFPNVVLWAGVDDRNQSVLKLNAQLGFKEHPEASEIQNHWLVMIKEL